MEHAPPFSLDDIAAMVGGRIIADRQVRILGVAGIESAGPGDVTFYENPRFLTQLRASRAAVQFGVNLERLPVALDSLHEITYTHTHMHTSVSLQHIQARTRSIKRTTTNR